MRKRRHETGTLFTGAILPRVPEQSGRSFGSISGSGPVDAPGQIRIGLNLTSESLAVRLSHKFVTIYLPESWAHELSSITHETVQFLRHMRSLARLGKLAETALSTDEVPQGGTDEDGALVVGPHDERLEPLDVVVPPAISQPKIVYGDEEEDAVILYRSAANEWIRLTFEGLECIRLCRGNDLAYKMQPASSDEQVATSIYKVVNSRWQQERLHYLTPDLDGLLSPNLSEHYYFKFKHTYVEALAEGIWVEESPQKFRETFPGKAHPRNILQTSMTISEIDLGGHTFQIRLNAAFDKLSMDDKRLGSQPLFHFVPLPAGAPAWRVDVRFRNGRPISILRVTPWRRLACWDGILTLEEARTNVEPFIRKYYENRGS